MDPLSDVFALLQVEALVSARFEAGGDWAVRFPAQPHIKFGAALRGRYWLILDADIPRLIEPGDTYLLTNCPSYVIASDPALQPVDGSALYAAAHGNRVRHGGEDTQVLGGSFVFDQRNAGLLMDVLPPLIRIPGNDPASAVLRITLQLLDDELQAQRMGTAVVTSRLGDVLLVQALRAHAASGAPTGWLGALGHPRIGAALRSMHGDVARNWKVEDLASAAGMSRSDFARKFKERVGLPPLDYLIRWRMHLARHALRQEGASVAIIARSLGYSSESAFGNAFKRMFGRSPKRYWTNE
ncbi:IS5 family transposase IS4811 [Pseudomonas carbonaria]|uniref:IS5 family transposase IS4811 n=2 Tax=Zestomonas carbonaria TaxID=2762745 RepID=A0A7U7ES74_9GAMM|nr:IS5 family transposase IS4811 [Pseudomonas carbonaria]